MALVRSYTLSAPPKPASISATIGANQYVGRDIFDATFDIHVETLEGHPVVTFIHGKVGKVGKTARGMESMGDGKTVDYKFTKIKFQSDVPELYFSARQYAGNLRDLPN